MTLGALGRAGLVAAALLAALTAQAQSVSATASRAAAATTDRSIALGVDTAHPTQAAVTQVESELGHQLAYTRDFLLWDSPFPTAYENWLGARGTVPMISVKSRLTNGTGVPWADVAAAQPGSTLYAQIQSWADRVKAFGYPVYFAYNHEPEAATNNDLGSPADYVAAWRHVHDVFAAEGATNATFIWITTSYAYTVPATDRRYLPNWYPGDAYVDAIGADSYNWSNCRYDNSKWTSLASIISGLMAFARQHASIPVYLAEFASVEDPNNAGRKAQWIQDAENLLKQPAYSQIAGVSYFNHLQSGSACAWPFDTSAASKAAMTTMAQDPFFQGTVGGTPAPPPPPPTGISFVASASTTGNSATETVRVPSTASPGDGLVLLATAGTAAAVSAPAGWTTVASKSSASLYSAVWQRVAAAGDPNAAVAVKFGSVRKGSVELLDYTGTSSTGPVAAAVGATVDKNSTAMTTPAATATGLLLSYWSVKTSVDTTITPGSDVTVRSAQTGTGGGRVVSVSADGPAGGSGARTAAVSPAAAHGLTWSVALAAAG